jgi:hypothetical protein
MKKILRVSFVSLLATLLVACGGGGSSGCSAVLGILPGAGCNTSTNIAPVANAGVTQNISVGSPVILDGSGSRDANNQSLTYLWQMTSVPPGSLAALSSATSPKPTFTADVAGTYTVSLVVNDGKATSVSSTVSVFSSVNNSAPVANAGSNQSITLGSVVTLDGTGSSDANRDSLTYKWSLSSVPTGSSATLSSAISPNPKFTADIAGSYTAILMVNDGKADSLSSTVIVTASAANSAPVANAGLAQSVKLKDIVTLDGTTSSDANNDFLTYKWTLITKPSGSSALLSASTSSKPTFTADVAGTFVASLIVNDGKVDSVAAATTVTVATANADPIANAGVNQNVIVNSIVTLDGSNSSDANRDPLTYRWALMSSPTGFTGTLVNPTSAKPTFTATVAGTYVISLIVNDGRVDSTTVATTVTASAANVRPVASAVTNQSVVLGSVTLDGTASSDANGDALNFRWSMVSKPTLSQAQLQLSTSSKPSFTADVSGVYVFSLIVNDNKLDSETIVVSVTAAALNVAPVAKIGANQNVALDPITLTKLVTLDGSTSSDDNGDTLTYSWTLVSRPDNSSAALTGESTAKPTFIADKSGVYVAALIVNDKKLDSKVATTTVTATVGNSRPTAVPGTLQSVVLGEVTLDGSASNDPNGDTLSYTWVLFGKPVGSSAKLDNANLVKPKFTADMVGTYAASLVVCDPGLLCSDITTTSVVVATANVAPVANAGTYQNVVTNSQVTLNGTGSLDANGDTIYYTWALVSQPASLITKVTLSSDTASNPTFTPPVSGTYVFSLKVSDKKLDSELKYVTITAGAANLAPVANAGLAIIATKGNKVTLDGSASSDANSDTLLWTWVLTYKPAGSLAALADANKARPYFTADVAGVYVATLVVSDGSLESNTSTVVVSVSP